MIKELESGVVVFEKRVNMFAVDNLPETSAKPSRPILKEYTKNKPWKPWGDDNIKPMRINDTLNVCFPAQVCIERLCTETFGRGFGVFENRVTDGKLETVMTTTAEHLGFFNTYQIARYLVNAITDYWTYGNQFAQFGMSIDRKKIAWIRNIDAPFVRLAYQNTKTGAIDHAFINGHWHLLPADSEIEKIALLDEYDWKAQLEKGANKILFHNYAYTPGEPYYHSHPWHAAFQTGVLDLQQEIPKIRKNRFKKSIFVKYHVQIEEQYWEVVYGDKKWKSATADERRALKSEVYQMIDKHLAGADNAFKSLFSGKITDPRTGHVTELITIKLVETDYGNAAAFDPDKMSNVADIFLAFDLPSATMNTVLNDTKSRGGGSDIREGMIVIDSRLKWHRETILKPVEMMMRYNGLLTDSQFLTFIDEIPTTLDKNPTGQQKVIA